MAVNGHMSVVNDLACFSSGACEAETVDDIIKSALEHDHHVLTGLALHTVRFLVIVAERFFQYAVDEFCFLFFFQLCTILGNLTVGAFQLS